MKTEKMAELEAKLDELDPATTPAQDARDLRTIVELVDQRTAVEERLREAVISARRNGKSWGKIAIALGTSRQSAHERYADETS